MAGDWIKVEHATLDKPEVAYFAELLGVKADEALGILLRFWVWLDRNARNGAVTHVTRLSLDSTMHCNGFTAAIVTVKWAEIDDATQTLMVPNFERHNENPAKSRSSNAERQARYRDKHRNESNAPRNVTSVTEALPEKRREEKKDICRATRLPADWRPSDVDRAYALQRLSHSALDLETQKFKNHWAAKAGRDGAKLDWPATWRTWVLNAVKFGAEQSLAVVPRRVAL